jgi:hypothetical protein
MLIGLPIISGRYRAIERERVATIVAGPSSRIGVAKNPTGNHHKHHNQA